MLGRNCCLRSRSGHYLGFADDEILAAVLGSDFQIGNFPIVKSRFDGRLLGGVEFEIHIPIPRPCREEKNLPIPFLKEHSLEGDGTRSKMIVIGAFIIVVPAGDWKTNGCGACSKAIDKSPRRLSSIPCISPFDLVLRPAVKAV